MNRTDDAREPGWTPVFAGWLIASASTLGSLFLSEVMHVTPCVLCWYQRICMYPLVLILPAGMFPLDRKLVRYAVPLSTLGLLIAVFHLLVVAGYIPENMQPCTQGVPCSEVQVMWFGFITIPLLSALAFLSITALLVLGSKRSKT